MTLYLKMLKFTSESLATNLFWKGITNMGNEHKMRGKKIHACSRAFHIFVTPFQNKFVASDCDVNFNIFKYKVILYDYIIWCFVKFA